MLIRTLSGVIYIAVIVACILCGEWGVMALGSLIGVLAVVELSRIDHELNRTTLPLAVIDCIGVVCLVLSFPLFMPAFLWIFTLIMRMVIQLYSNSRTPLRDMALSFMSQLYIGIPMMLMVAIACLISPMTVLAMFILIWLNDTGAFLFGSMLGRHKLFERVSPKKTWEGFFGGVLLTVGGALLMGHFFSGFFAIYGLGRWAGFGIVAAVFATWGDLTESLIKRSLKIKDSGTLIPGHGGILDRVDSLLFVAPASFLYFTLMRLIQF